MGFHFRVSTHMNQNQPTKAPIALALDAPNIGTMRSWVNSVAPYISTLKVGMESFYRDGAACKSEEQPAASSTSNVVIIISVSTGLFFAFVFGGVLWYYIKTRTKVSKKTKETEIATFTTETDFSSGKNLWIFLLFNS